MKNTFQHKNQSVFEHGESVHRHYKNIITALDNSDTSYYDFPT